MQTPKARNGPLQLPLKASSKTSRQVKMRPQGSDSVPVPVRTPKKANPRVTIRKSFPSPVSELTRLEEELKQTKEQFNLSELLRKQALQEAEMAKSQLASTSDKLEESQKQLIELLASEDGRILELCKLSHDRDRAWQSELEALQKHHASDSSALAFAKNEISKLRFQLKESLFFIDELKSEIKDCKESKETLESEELKVMDEDFDKSDENNEDLEKLKIELNCARSEVAGLKTALDIADKRYQEEHNQSTFQIRSAYELVERTKSESSVRKAELESKLKKAKDEIDALEMRSKNLEEDSEVLKACLLCKEEEIRCMSEENKMLKMEIEKREKEPGRASNEDVALADSEREAELRRLKIQSDQWRKAAEVATAMLSNENDDNYHTIGGKLGLPFSEDIDEQLTRKKSGATMLKKIGVLLKGGPK